MCLLFQFVRGCITLVLFAAFIAWDIQHLSQEAPVATKKTIGEDPAAALSEAREELARMMKEERSRSR